MTEYNNHVWGIILAGGEGKRLQSFIRTRYGSNSPKQYCAFTGTRSMLRHTIDRAERFIRPEQLVTIVSKQHVRYAQEQLSDRPSWSIIVQPFNRETGPRLSTLSVEGVYWSDWGNSERIQSDIRRFCLTNSDARQYLDSRESIAFAV